MNADVVIAGVGITPFTKPSAGASYDDLAEHAARAALADAGISYELVEQAYAGYSLGDTEYGQASLYRLGHTGIPIINVNNACASGSSALWLARQAVASGVAGCVLAVGFEQMDAGAIAFGYQNRPTPLAPHEKALGPVGDTPRVSLVADLFAKAADTYIEKHGAEVETFAKISVKARKHASMNPGAIFRTPITEAQVLGSPKVSGLLTVLQCCPPTSGAAAAIVCSPEFARRHGLDDSVRIRAQALVTDTPEAFATGDMMKVIGYDMARAAADKVYEAAGVDPSDIHLVELHDCFTTNELVSYESLRLTPEGTAEKFVLDGDNTYGGRVVTNPSGGLLSKGHPLGATGLGQCYELVTQLRGRAGARQVPDVRHALQHNLGLGGACVVTLYEKATP